MERDVGELVGLFPAGAAIDTGGRLTVAGISLVEVAEQFGTPAYVIDEAALRARVRRFAEALAAQRPGSRMYFASKAFPCVAAYRLMAEEGVGVDVAGAGELAAALRGGVPGPDILLHGNAKSDVEIAAAVKAEAGLIVVDNFDDIDRLERLMPAAREQNVLVRVRPGLDVNTHAAVATGHDRSKFGLPLPRAREAVDRIRSIDGLHLSGVHAHIGSQIFDLEPFRAATRALAELGEFEVYDLGGGLAARYTYADHPPEPEEWIGAVTDAANEYLPDKATLLIEPGRSVVASTGLTLYRVTTVKRGDEHPIVAVDGGMADNLEVALFGQRFEATVADRVGGGELVDLVGRQCESGDRLSLGVALNGPHVGDVLAVPATGAYCYTMQNSYNGAMRPPVVFVADGAARLVVRRETEEDYFSRDVS